MITHDWLIFNGYYWRQFEGETENSYAGEYRKIWCDKNGHQCMVYIFKFNEEKDDFNKTTIEVHSITGQTKTTFIDKPVLTEHLNMLIKIICE